MKQILSTSDILFGDAYLIIIYHNRETIVERRARYIACNLAGVFGQIDCQNVRARLNFCQANEFTHNYYYRKWYCYLKEGVTRRRQNNTRQHTGIRLSKVREKFFRSLRETVRNLKTCPLFKGIFAPNCLKVIYKAHLSWHNFGSSSN